MLRRAVLIGCAAALLGCQARPAPPAVRACDAEMGYEAVPAAALVFDPPVIQADPPLELTRAGREAGVAVGYEELTVERFYIRVDDRQITSGFGGRAGRFGGGGNFDRYERRAITERVGVRYR